MANVNHFEETKSFEKEMYIHNLLCYVNGTANLTGWYVRHIGCVEESYEDGESEVTIDDGFTVVAYDDNGKEINLELTDKEKSDIKEELVEYAERELF